MRGAIFVGDSEIELRELPDPTPGPGEAVIAIKASGLCGSDLRAWYHVPRAERGDPDKLAVGGHEPCGVIAEVGPGVTSLKVGDRVMMHHYSGCNACKMCRIGYTQMCMVGREGYGSSKNGGHEDYLLCPASTCVPLPDEVSFEEGSALACGSGTAFFGLKRLNLTGMDTLAIFGQGPVGLSGTIFAKAMGVRVLAVDVVPERLELAKRLGADTVVDSSKDDVVKALRDLTSGEGPGAVLDATGLAPVRHNALDSVALWGRVCFVGEGNPTVFDVSEQIIHKQLTIYGSWTMSLSGLEEAANFVVDRKVPLKDHITHTFSLDEVKEAYQLFDSGKTGKVILTF